MSKYITLPIPKALFEQTSFSELKSNLNSLPEVTKLETSNSKSTLTLEIDKLDASTKIIDEISKWGYDIPINSVKLGIIGMTCASCVMHVENAISNLNGVITSNVNLATNQANVKIISGVVSDSEISQAVKEIGYETIDPSEISSGPGLGFGVKPAAVGASRHIRMAADSEGASGNVTTHTQHVETSANNTVQRADKLIALAKAIQEATTVASAATAAERLNTLAAQLISGHDANGDGRIGWQENEGGLQQAEQHANIMKKGEGLP